MIGKAIFSQLTGNAPVAALVAGRVYPELATDQKDYPAIVYDADDDKDEARSLSGVASLRKYTVNLAVIARDYPTLIDLCEKTIAALDNQAGTWGGIVVQGAFYEPSGDETILHVQDAGRIRFSMKELAFTVWAES